MLYRSLGYSRKRAVGRRRRVRDSGFGVPFLTLFVILIYCVQTISCIYGTSKPCSFPPIDFDLIPRGKFMI